MNKIKYKISDFTLIEKGKSPILKTKEGQYPLVVTAEKRKSSDSFQFNTKAVCIPLVSSTGHGHASIKRIHYQKGKFALASIMIALIPDEQICHTKYLYYYIYHIKDKILVPLMKGSANVTLSMSDVKKIEIELPNIEKQKEIVSHLEKIDEMITDHEKMYEDSRSFSHSFCNKLFHNGITNNVSKETKIGRIPENWDIMKIDEIADVKGGKRLPSGYQFENKKTKYPYLRVVDFDNESINVKNLKYINKETHEKISKYVISSNDVYISIAGSVGIVGLIPEELNNSNLTENAARFCNLKNISKEYLTNILNSDMVQIQIQKSLKTTAQPKLALFKIKNLEIPLPSMIEQKQISDIIKFQKTIFNKLILQKKELHMLKTSITDQLLQ